MSDELERAAELIAPQIAIPVKTAKIALAILAVLAALLVGGWIIWKLFFAERAAQAKHDQVQTEATIGTAQAGQASAKDAVRITIDNGKAAAEVDRAVREAINGIAKVKGADQRLDPALDNAGRLAICMRSSAAGLSGCQSLQRPGPGGLGE